MLITLKELLVCLDEQHARIEQTIADLPPEALNWAPASGMNSIAVLAAHTAGAERYWVRVAAGDEAVVRDRDAEFATDRVDAAQLLDQLAEALAQSHALISRLTPLDLEQVRVAPRDGRRVTAAWALLHTLEHTALHLGHMQVTRDFWEQQ
jgi:uncharacterized damage-inducible protein DinB